MSSLVGINTKADYSLINPEIEAVFKNITSKIPHTLHGPDRVSFLIELLPSISYEDKELLIELFNSLLKVMIEQEASDIELGGFGSEGFVWFRIYGTKEPLPELPKFGHDESALLILSILNEKQRKIYEYAFYHSTVTPT